MGLLGVVIDLMPIIMLSGRKGAGKDTVADHLIEKYGYVKISFAEPLKDACKAIFGFSDAQVNHSLLKETVDEYWEYTPREVLQCVGTELFRDALGQALPKIGNEIWIRALERRVMRLKNDGITNIVITDARFENEVECGRRIGATIIKIDRPRFRGGKFVTHASEAGIDSLPCDHVLTNDRTIAELYRQVDGILDAKE